MVAAGLRDEGKVEGGGEDGGTLREWGTGREKVQEQKEEQGIFFCFWMHVWRGHIGVRCAGVRCAQSIVTLLPVMCTNNDGMESQGVVFKVAEKMRDAGVRPLLPYLPHPPHHPRLLHPPIWDGAVCL